MPSRELRVDSTGTIHPIGRTASQELRQRAGEWRLSPSAHDVLLLRSAKGPAVLRLAGEITTPGALCDVIALAAQSSWGGELLVFGETSVRCLYFDAGTVVGATTNVAEERLGETLYRFGVLTREQVDAAVAAATERGKRFGEILVDLSFVSQSELYPMMARQVEEVFYGAIQEREGVFYFFDRFDEQAVGLRHTLHAGGLLMEAARRMDEMRYFRDKIPNDSFVPTPTGTPKKVPDEVQAVYAQCDGKRSVAEVGRLCGMLEFEVTRAVFQLCSGGFVTVAAARPQGAQAIVEVFNPALVLIHRRCDTSGKGVELRGGLAQFAMGAGIYEPLFMGAGPTQDGSLRPAGVARNLGALAGDDPDAWLLQQLHEYVGFALFQAGSLLPREAEGKLAQEVAELLKPVRPVAGGGGEPPPVPSRKSERI